MSSARQGFWPDIAMGEIIYLLAVRGLIERALALVEELPASWPKAQALATIAMGASKASRRLHVLSAIEVASQLGASEDRIRALSWPEFDFGVLTEPERHEVWHTRLRALATCGRGPVLKFVVNTPPFTLDDHLVATCVAGAVEEVNAWFP